jgi:hypothetical protein
VHSCRRTHRFAPCEREILTSHVVSQEDSVATSSEYDCPANDSPRVILLSAPFGALLFQTHWLPTFESQCLCGLYSFATSSTSTIQKRTVSFLTESMAPMPTKDDWQCPAPSVVAWGYLVLFVENSAHRKSL